MKRYVYVLWLVVAATGLDACKKAADPVPVPEVVAKWASDRIRVTGLPAVYASSNKDYDAYDFAGIRTAFELKADKTLAGTDRSSGITDFKGTWDYTTPNLTLKLDNGSEQKLTYDASTLPTLLSVVAPQQDTLTNPTTKKDELVKYNIQLVYTKQ